MKPICKACNNRSILGTHCYILGPCYRIRLEGNHCAHRKPLRGIDGRFIKPWKTHWDDK